MNLIDRILEASSNLPAFSASSMPYTYHHDWIRSNHPKYIMSSRAEVSKDFENRDISEIYAVAFIFLVSISDPMDLLKLSMDDISMIKSVFNDCNNLILGDEHGL